MTTIVWLRRDLRLADNPALVQAAARGEVIPLFCFDDQILQGRHASGNRTRFLLESLQDLRQDLRRVGGDLVIRRGEPAAVLAELARAHDCALVLAAADYTPYARRRDARAQRALAVQGIELRLLPGVCAIDSLDALKAQTGRPYSIFTPFYRRWTEAARRAVMPPPARLKLPAKLEAGELPTLAVLGLEAGATAAKPGGSLKAAVTWREFRQHHLEQYVHNHDDMSRDATSHLSAYLHFGCISPLQLEVELGDSEGARAFGRQLAWRDFYHYVLYHFPANQHQEFLERYRALAWGSDEQALEAWQRGRTGLPLVDAGMRQLIDGDEAINNGNWQWIASVGVDPAPVFRRLYNPVLHHRRYDPESRYVKRYVPELRQVPEAYLFEPWTMPLAIQIEAGCRIGIDYPAPIVDLRASRAEALARYRA